MHFGMPHSSVLLYRNALTFLLYFRNLCIDGGFDICAEMYNKNILAPLRAFIPKVNDAFLLEC